MKTTHSYRGAAVGSYSLRVGCLSVLLMLAGAIAARAQEVATAEKLSLKLAVRRAVQNSRAMALARLRRVALVVGPVALTRFEENPGAHHIAVYVRRDSLPDEPPDPGQLLVSLQKVQQELLAELGPPHS